ncbi:MAG: hypothetical protein LBL59_10405 [Xanthomonadaceae bacterium]|jgi:hypothetical protein|nr:hypothetical protein [Xanthomonadaceae bacterium]
MSRESAGCWSILGLAPTTDRKAVRSAYALVLKSLDLATQADEFAALRQAYEQALKQIADGAVPEAVAPPVDPVAAPPEAPYGRMGTIPFDDSEAPARMRMLAADDPEAKRFGEAGPRPEDPERNAAIDADDRVETDSMDPAAGNASGDGKRYPEREQDASTPLRVGYPGPRPVQPAAAGEQDATGDEEQETPKERDVSAPLRARDLGLRPAQQTAPSEAELAQLAAGQRVNAFFQLCDSLGVPRTAILRQALRDFLDDDALDSLLARELFVKELANRTFAERLYTPALIPALSTELGWELDMQAMPATAGSARLAFQRWQRQRDYQRLQQHYSAAECEALDDARVEWRVRAAHHIATVAGEPDVGKLTAMTGEVLTRRVETLSASEQEKHVVRLKQLIVDDVAEIGHYGLYCAVADVFKRERMSPQEFERNHYYVAQELLGDGRVTRATRQTEQRADPKWERIAGSVREAYAAWEQKRLGAFLRFFLGNAFGFMLFEGSIISKLDYLRRNRRRWSESFTPPCLNWLRGMCVPMYITLAMATMLVAITIVIAPPFIRSMFSGNVSFPVK